MRRSSILSAALAGAFLIGCDATPTAPADQAGGIQASVTDGPSMPGDSHLIRIGVQEWIISTADPENEIFTIYGDPLEIFDCGGPGGPEYSVQFNELELAMGRMRNLLAQGADIPIYVYDFFTPDDLDGRTFCEYFAEEWKYRGFVHYVEMFHRNRVQNNMAWTWNTNGEVEDVDGNPYSFHESQVAVRAGDGTFIGWLKENIMVTPRGN